jgi:acyl-[acyl-carrier-protein]-phospholipid O-acyltransferase/long-chain-fatty-acid--[acyl-carrier-protein] ligase
MKVNSLLKNYGKFFPLLVCQFSSCFGDSFLRALFILLITFRVDISETAGAIMVSLAMALFMVPFFFISSSKSNSDYLFDKVLVMRRLQIVQIFIAALAIYGFIFASHITILSSIVLYGVYSVLFSEIRHSIMCSVLKREPSVTESQKIRLAALFGLVFGIVASGVIGIYFSSDAVLQSVVLISAPIISYVSSLFISRENHEKQAKSSYIIESPLECWRKATKNRNIRYSLQGIAWFWLLGAIFMSQLPALTRDDLHCDASAFILLLTIFFLGIGVGTSISNSILKKEIGMHFVPTAMLVISIFAFDIANLAIHNKFSGHLKDLNYFLSYRDGINLAIDFFFLACAGGMFLIPLYKYLQLSSNKPYRTQIRVANNVMNAIFVGAGSIITIVLLSLGIEASSIIVLLACTNFLTAVYICKILPNTVIKNAFRTLFVLLYRIEVSGIENLIKAGNKTLIISNHTSFLDPVILSAFIPGRVYFAVGDDIGKARITKLFMKILNGRTIDYNHPLSAKTIIDKLKSKEQVVMFPEGRISVTGSLMKIYDSPGVIAEKAGASLLPIKIRGTEFSIFSKMGGKLKLKIFPKIKMTIFPLRSISLKQEELSSSREARHIIGDKLYDIMSESMFSTEDVSQTLFEALVSASKKFGPSSKVIGDTHKVILTYRKLIAASFILGNKIAKQTKHSERVGILLPNMSGTVAVFFAMIAYGRTPALLNFSTGIKNMLSCCKAATVKTVFTSKAFIDVADLHNLVKALEDVGIKIVYMESLRKSINSHNKFSGLLKSYFPLFYHNRYAISKGISATSPAAVLFTSGSEGAPKGVVLSHKNIISNLQQVVSRIDISSSDRLFNALPMFHSFGLTAGTIMPLLSGVFTFLYPSPLHYRIIPEMIYANNSTIFFGTDTFLSGYAKYAHPYDFFSVRYVCAGAEALRNETRKIWMDKFGIRVLEGYGATEASPVISLNTPLHCKNGTAGRMLPSISWKIEPVEGIASGGRLVISGPNVMLGYLKSDKPGVIEPPSYSIDGKLMQGWYDTGDIVSIDEENYITIEGRVKRFAKIAGEMVSLLMIEEAINTLWPDSRNAAIAISEPKRGEAIMIFTTKKDPSREEIAQFFHSSGYAEIFCPRKVMFIDEIPVLGTGKTDYVSLQEIALQL